MNRTTFLVDGFNVYHSVIAASNDLGGKSTKWLDFHSLLSSYLPVIGAGASLENIYYFTALAHHMDSSRPGVTARHRAYIECLKSTGVIPILSRFKYKKVYCHICKKENVHYEEKETDVAISIKLMEQFYKDEADTVVLVTGDTDLAPAVRSASQLFPTKQIAFAFPYKRKNNELAQLVSKYFLIRKERYVAHQLADPFVLPSGRNIPKPNTW
jgi:uncharacterized LabA/DUF88 family protein